MPNRSYERGYRYEREIVKRFTTAGALFISRGAGSHGSDIIAVFPDEVAVIEAKTTTEYPPPLYTEELTSIANRVKQLWYNNAVVVGFWIKVMGRGELHLQYLRFSEAWEVTFDEHSEWWLSDPVMLEWKKKVCYGD